MVLVGAVTRTIAAWLTFAVVAFAVGTGAWLGYRFASDRCATRIATYEQAAREASEAARQQEQEMRDAIETIQREYMQRVEAGRRDAAGARGELRRLRDSLAARERAAAEAARAAGRADAAAAERDVLRACTAQLVAVAQDADRIAVRLTGLQEYVRSIQQGELAWN